MDLPEDDHPIVFRPFDPRARILALRSKISSSQPAIAPPTPRQTSPSSNEDVDMDAANRRSSSPLPPSGPRPRRTSPNRPHLRRPRCDSDSLDDRRKRARIAPPNVPMEAGSVGYIDCPTLPDFTSQDPTPPVADPNKEQAPGQDEEDEVHGADNEHAPAHEDDAGQTSADPELSDLFLPAGMRSEDKDEEAGDPVNPPQEDELLDLFLPAGMTSADQGQDEAMDDEIEEMDDDTGGDGGSPEEDIQDEARKDDEDENDDLFLPAGMMSADQGQDEAMDEEIKEMDDETGGDGGSPEEDIQDEAMKADEDENNDE